MNEASYKSMSGRSFMLITCSESGKNIDTQIRLLAAGEMKAILPMIPTSKNGEAILQYDITGLTRLSGITQYGKLNREQLFALVEGLVAVLEDCSSFALSTDGVNLHSDHVYYDLKSGAVKFVYIPTLRGGNQLERYREMLRALIAFGNVEPCALTEAITNGINRSSFAINDLREVLRNYNTGYPYAASPAQASRHPAPRASRDPSLPVGELRKTIIAAVQGMEDFDENESRFFNSERKRSLIISVAVVASLALIAAAGFALSIGRLNASHVTLVLILLCAADYFLLRKYILNVSHSPEEINGDNGGNDADDVSDISWTEKDTDKQESTIKPFSAPESAYTEAASHPPVYAPPPPRYTPPPESVPVAYDVKPAPYTPQAEPDDETFVADEPDDETVVFDEPDTGLYLETVDGEEIPLSKNPFLIGRDRNLADYRLTDSTIGRKHAEFENQNGNWVITDKESRNHTYLNGDRLEPNTAYPISEGDEIKLAKVVTLWVRSR